jgi:CO/xanthine dehydrogenase FAD-binding subunit
MATVGGALAVAHLPSDLAVALLALDARLEMVGARGTTIRLEDLLKQGWLKGHDLMLKVTAAKPRRGRGTHFAKFGRSAIDIALVNTGVSIELAPGGKIEVLRLVVGQSYSLPVLLADVAEEARGKTISASIIEDIARKAAASIKPRSDFRASGEYRKHLVEVLVARSLAGAAAEAGAKLDG